MENNTGFENRRKIFLEDNGKRFSAEWAPLTGRLNLDAATMKPGILPGLEVVINIEYSSDDFRLICGEAKWEGENDVVIEISDAHLTVPIAQLQPKVYQLNCIILLLKLYGHFFRRWRA